MKWYGIEKGRFWFIEKLFMWKARSFYRFCRRHNLTWAEVYMIDSDGSATVNFRAKRSNIIVADGYAFVRSKTKKE